MSETEVFNRRIRTSPIWVGTTRYGPTGEWTGWYLRLGRKVRALLVRDL